jgi:hypothetical protein
MTRPINSAAAVALLFAAATAGAQARPAMAAPTPSAGVSQGDPMREMAQALRDLITQQEKYWAGHGSYTTDGVALGTYPMPKKQLVMVQVIFAGSRGWTGMATYRGLKGKSCVVYVGVEAELPKIPATWAEHLPAQVEGQPRCDAP